MFFNKEAGPVFFLIFIALSVTLSGCGDLYPENPFIPESTDEGVQGAWQDVLANDPAYPSNVYLTENIKFHPGLIGSARISDSSPYYTSDGYPKESTKNGACGPPEGSSAIYSSSGDMTVLGSGGWAVWKFDPAWVIVDGEGDDFITFSNHNIFGGDPDGSWNELAHVYASEDGGTWYISASESYIAHPSPGNAADGYRWSEVHDIHGNNHSWANFRKDIEAEYLNPSTGLYETLLDGNGESVLISKYFEPTDENLGGDYFDLANFVAVDSSGIIIEPIEPWPTGGKMRYLKLVDDPSILDGQDWSPAWMTGARLMSAMGINVEAAQ